MKYLAPQILVPVLIFLMLAAFVFLRQVL